MEWDTTAFGKYKVASGVYMIFISAQDGVETKVKSNDYPLNFKHVQVKTKAIVLSSIKFQEKKLDSKMLY
jgi:hypothetical protein